jgi:hypothetical protein
MKTRTVKGKGATRAKIEREETRPKPKSEGLSIAAITFSAGQKPAPREKGPVGRFEKEQCSLIADANRLPAGGSFMDAQRPNIEYLLNRLVNVGGTTLPRSMEVEVRLLYGSDPDDLDSFSRVYQWLHNHFPMVQALEFQERKYVIGAERLGSPDYVADYVWRGATETYAKIKSRHNLASRTIAIALPAIGNLIPRLGVSSEIRNFPFDTSAAGHSISNRKRWSYPINTRTAVELGIDMGFSLQSENFEEQASGVIDLTVTNVDGVLSYSIEIELDSNTIKSVDVQEKPEIFAGQPVLGRPLRTVSHLTVSHPQLHLLDTWLKILSTVINKTGVLLTSDEKEAVEQEFNKTLGINSKYLRSFMVNKPKDLQKRDLAWLRPEESDLFMKLGSYDETPDENSRRLHELGIYQPLLSIPGGYYVSLKADGTRYYFFSARDGIYLINAQSCVVTKITGPRTPYGRFFNLLTGTILDVEVLGDIEPDGTFDEYQILVFDVLTVAGRRVDELSYTERLKHIQSAVDYFNNDQEIEKQVQENLKTGIQVRDTGWHWKQLFRIQAKPVWKLPSPSDLAFNPKESQVERHFKLRTLAKDFFSILGAAAERAQISNAEGYQVTIVKDGQEISTDPFPQITGGIEWYSDGLILTPAERPYLEKLDLFRQNLPDDSNYSLVRKWKQIPTIDYRISRVSTGSLSLFSFDQQSREDVVFSDRIYPWNGNAELTPDMEGKIFEFRWGYSEVLGDMAFIATRERTDRSFPNPLKVARAVWGLINDPITVDDLKGWTLTRMRRYHNRVKEALLTEMASKVDVPVLMDIGSGRGGDLTKWKKFKHVYAVEPDVQNLRELISRKHRLPTFDSESLSELEEGNKNDHYVQMAALHQRSEIPGKPKVGVGHGKIDNVTTINAGGENIIAIQDVVPARQVNCVSVMNALTFFYDSLDHIQQLIQTITHFLVPGGYCYMIAFDGELLLNSMQMSAPTDTKQSGQMPSALAAVSGADQTPLVHTGSGLEDASGTVQTHNSIKTRNLTVAKAGDPSCRKVWIKIEGAIVRGQFEYLINTRELVHIMDGFGFRILDERYLNEETLLSAEEYWFSSIFKVLKFQYSTSPAKRDLRNFFSSFAERMEASHAIQPLEPHDAPQEIVSSQLAPFNVGRLLRYGNPQDGSCYIHGVLRAFSRHYKGFTESERKNFVGKLRAEMASNYTEAIHNAVGDGFFHTSQLPAYSYENVKASIGQTTFWVSSQLLSFIGEQLNTNVYILRGVDPVVYKFGYTLDHIKPGRKNVVLLWINDNHYETVGVLEPGNQVRLVFADNHPLIIAARQLI